MSKYLKATVGNVTTFLGDKISAIYTYPNNRIKRIADVFEHENAKRLVSCWNACNQLEHPESDLPKIIEALKKIKHISFDIGNSSIERLCENALVLIKEE